MADSFYINYVISAAPYDSLSVQSTLGKAAHRYRKQNLSLILDTPIQIRKREWLGKERPIAVGKYATAHRETPNMLIHPANLMISSPDENAVSQAASEIKQEIEANNPGAKLLRYA